MEFLHSLLVILHIVGTASILGGVMSQTKLFKSGQAAITSGILHGGLLQLVTGLALVGLAEMGDGSVNHVKIAVKTVVLVAILLIAIAYRKKETAPTWAVGTIGGLTLVNIILAVSWH